MGVTGLWTVVHPCARPIKIETLNKKRLAVDASIWIYQFLKAVRDKEGNQLRNSHVVGFFRRICKLLFIGIRPVFVFDGGAPALKRQTINTRKRRREGRREDAARTAGKLLALQVERSAQEEDKRRKDSNSHTNDTTEEPIPEDVIYASEVAMTKQERMMNRTFRKTDAYHLPDLSLSMAEMGQPNDPRVMSLEELQEYANTFVEGEDINVYDFSKIDYDSTFFQSLPPSDQYNILNAARLRSRLRMGYSKEQLDSMFPDRMAFSRFQIERVTERNELTQRLIRLLGMNEDGTLNTGIGRVAGEKGREYVLIKNDGVEGGWALGVVSSADTGKKERPIVVEEYDKPKKHIYDADDDEEDEEFEDVPIAGLNRLPKQNPRDTGLLKDLLTASSRRRKDFYQDRREAALRRANQEADSLFVEQDPATPTTTFQPAEKEADEEDADLQKAIQLSLQHDHPQSDAEDDDFEEVFAPQKKAASAMPFSRGSGTAIAHVANQRAANTFSQPFADDSDEEDIVDLQAELSKAKPKPAEIKAKPDKQVQASKPRNFPGFDGPLPFEQLDLGLSLFNRKKPEKVEETGGGFVAEQSKKKPESVLPPWFAEKEKSASQLQQQPDFTLESDVIEDQDFVFETRARPTTAQAEVIDLESFDASQSVQASDSELVGNTQASIAEVTDNPQIGQSQISSVAPISDASHRSPAAEEAEEDDMEWEDIDKVELDSTSQDHQPLAAVPHIEAMTISDTLTNENRELEEVYEAVDDGLLASEVQPYPIDEEEDEYTYSDLDDDDLLRQLAQEEKEHARFTTSLNPGTQSQAKPSARDFDQELKQLRNQQKKDRRDADEVTQTMITECQQLLSLFGLPYITAPMEAEAQCAELVKMGLVDGVVTDDSDIFLFGGTRVYKNMFNQAKIVECYLSKDLEAEFGLTRQRLISIAHLLGSDYTDGLPGVGPVSALEILSEFDDLERFKEWWASVQTGLRSKDEDAKNAFRKKFRRSNMSKLFLPGSFPDRRVDDAYFHPEVDADPSVFAWGIPDLNALRSFLMHTIGWSPERTDEVLVPVIRDMNKRETEGTQSNITQFFQGTTGAGAFAPRQKAAAGSKRLRSALEKIGQRDVQSHVGEDEDEAYPDEPTKKSQKRQRGKSPTST